METSVKALEMEANGLCDCGDIADIGEASRSPGDSDFTRLWSLTPSSMAMLRRDGEGSRL